MPHIHDKIDFSVDVFIVHKNKVLLRKHDKFKIWLAVGGHIELDEEPNQAAVREVKEEVGLDIELFRPKWCTPIIDEKNHIDLIPPFFLNKHKINDEHEHVSFIFFAKSRTDKIIPSETEVSEECKWFTKKELESKDLDIREKIRSYATQALEFVK